VNLELAAKLVDRLFPGAKQVAIERLTGGVSADVYRLDIDLAGGGATRVILRVHGATHSGHPAELEYQLLKALYQGGLAVPEPLMVDVSGELLPDPFLVTGFVAGSSDLPADRRDQRIEAMANELKAIHASSIVDLPDLPSRINPLPEVFDFLPEGPEWNNLRAQLHSLSDTGYTGSLKLLHGDFWFENLLWQQDTIAAVLDWEDAAVGDPLCDVAVARVELRYQFGKEAMGKFTEAYLGGERLDKRRLALWQVYVAAAAQKYMGLWGLSTEREKHMRAEALASIREAGIELAQL
jgi:aminoglycoside phosphotransferase (APT) family kinase protein